MFDMSWGEIMVIGGVALIVIGPKDLPKALRTVGQMTNKVRRMAGEFQSQFSEAMREAELEDVRKEVEGLNRDVAAATSTAFNPIQTIRDELKGSVEGRPAGPETPAATPGDWAAGQSEPTVTAVEETGSIPHIEPVTEPVLLSSAEPLPLSRPEPGASIPEVQPLVPLPSDEPVLPIPDPTRITTGPGLEPAGEADLPTGARA